MNIIELTGFAASGTRRGLIARLKMASSLWRQRQHLARLDDRALSDLGLTRQDVARELSQPFWMQAGWGEINQPRR